MLDVRPLCVDVEGVEQALIVDGKTYSKEEAIYQDTYSSDGSAFVAESDVPTLAGYTVLGFVDKSGETVDWSTIRRTGTGVNQFIYVKYLVGEWTLVKNASNVVDMLKNSENKNFYLMNDVDCTGTTLNVSANAEFKGTLYGNGKTISNFSVASTSYVMNGTYSLFGKIATSAVLKNFTLKNVSVEFSYGIRETDAFSVSYFCSAMEGTVENVKIDGGSFKVDFPKATIINLNEDATLTEWLGTELLTVVGEPTFKFEEKSE
jgi:hypothetical protein